MLMEVLLEVIGNLGISEADYLSLVLADNKLSLMKAEDGWRSELTSLFAARANPALHRERLSGLASLAEELLPDASGYDIDIADLLRLAVEYANTLDAGSPSLEESARRLAGAAFLHAGNIPTNEDRDLIAKGNGVTYSGDVSSKRARDTWAYVVYKRTKHDDRRSFYSYKPGADLRGTFRDALIGAVTVALASDEKFRAFVRDARRVEQNARSLDYADKRQGVASTSQKKDRADARDVNLPDGSLVPLGARFTKTWEVHNIGQVAWIGRRLTRHTPQGVTFPSSSDWVPIPDTFPGETVLLSVDFVAARVQGFTEVRFKMTDEHGNLYFPNKYPYGLTLLIETAGVDWIERPLT